MVKNTSVVMAGALALGIGFSSADVEAQYEYRGPVIARNSGVTCRASTSAAESWIRHNQYGSELNPNMTGVDGTVPVWCPIDRRNTAPFRDSGTGSGDEIDLDSVDVWVKHMPTGALGKMVACRVTANSHQTGSTIWSETKYACATDGGCAAQDATTGYRHLKFSRPLGAKLSNKQIVNMTVNCSIARGTSIIGYTSTFTSY